MAEVGQIIKNGMGAIELDRKSAWKDEGFIVLCVIPKRREFVTWFLDVKGHIYSGHYSLSLKDAMEDFGKRL
jgi:hypothetical protein